MSDVSLVTGGLGFIGKHVVDQLVQRGDRVRVLDLRVPE
jgi:nucleoside-diphosphate-sugar epimerase